MNEVKEEVFGYDARKKSNETVMEALRRKAMLVFTFEKNAHRLNLTDKKYENTIIQVWDNVDADHKYTFDLSNISARNGDFERLLNEYNYLLGEITIRCTTIFKNEIFVGEKLEDKEFVESTEIEEYTTTEDLTSIFYKIMN